MALVIFTTHVVNRQLWLSGTRVHEALTLPEVRGQSEFR